VQHMILFLIACGLAAVVPFVPLGPSTERVDASFPGWPSHVEGRSLTAAPLSAQEQRFEQGFPGRIAKFTDGSRAVIVRWVARETRKLHPARDCFRGSGYRVTPLPLHRDEYGNLWGCFAANRGQENLLVRERICDDSGLSWTDVSAWYWAALLGRSAGPWWATTVVQTAGAGKHLKFP
jgi:hypothetical protein